MSRPLNIPESQKQVIDDLLSKVKGMSSEDFKSMLDSFRKFHNYSFFNKCLIFSSGASQVAGKTKWNDLKRKVVEGAKPISILAPSMLCQVYVNGRWEKSTEYQWKKFHGQKRKFPVGFFAVQVYDIKDTEGEALEEPMTKASKISYEMVEKAAKNLGYKVEKSPLEFNLGGYISKKNIVINENRQESGNVGTLIHELAHGELGHTDTSCTASTDLMEVQAETVTYMVCRELGVERNSEFYLKAWGMSENIMMDFAALAKVADKLIRDIQGNALRFITE